MTPSDLLEIYILSKCKLRFGVCVCGGGGSGRWDVGRFLPAYMTPRFERRWQHDTVKIILPLYMASPKISSHIFDTVLERVFCVRMLFIILSIGRTSVSLADFCSMFKLAAFSPKVGG